MNANKTQLYHLALCGTFVHHLSFWCLAFLATAVVSFVLIGLAEILFGLPILGFLLVCLAMLRYVALLFFAAITFFEYFLKLIGIYALLGIVGRPMNQKARNFIFKQGS